MMKHVLKSLVLLGLVTLASCFGQHNNAPNEGVNLDDTRIYGVKGGEPKQLNNKYPEDESGEVAERAEAIRNKFFPKPEATETPSMPAANSATDSTATDAEATDGTGAE